MKFPLHAFALAIALPFGAQAATYANIVAGDSRIDFQYSQMGVGLEGTFQKFTGELAFDPAQPGQGKAVIEVDLGSVDAGTDDANEELVKNEWLNLAAFPQARFESREIKDLGGGKYEVAGDLSIKGTTHPVIAPATFTEQDGKGVFTGSFTIRRGDFSIGEGSWSTFDIVANEVTIDFQLTATP